MIGTLDRKRFDEGQKYFLQSAPIKVHMAGFEADTLKLQNNGWQMSVETFVNPLMHGNESRVVFKHDGIKQIAMGIMRFDQMSMFDPQRVFDWYKQAGIVISVISPIIRVQVIPSMNIPAFHAVDATPRMTPYQDFDLMDLAVFKPIKGDSFEIIINQKDEQEILDILLKKQDIKQAEIRKNNKRRDYLKESTGMVDEANSDIKHQLVICA